MSKKTSPRVPPTISVHRRAADKNGIARAQLFTGSAASEQRPLSDFSDAVQEKLRDAPPGAVVICAPLEPVDVTKLVPVDAPSRPVRPASEPIPRSLGNPAFRPSQRGSSAAPEKFTVAEVGVSAEGKRLSITFDRPFKTTDDGRTISTENAESLGLADVVIGARPDAVFDRQGGTWKLVGYAPESNVRCGLGAAPDVNRNPYNFAEFSAGPVLCPESPQKGCVEPGLSGRIDLTLTTRTPIFIPQGRSGAKGEELDWSVRPFFRMSNGENEHFAIPGASIKGPVRALFEAFTAGRCSVADEEARSHVYRRRSAALYIIDALPSLRGPGSVSRVEYALLDAAGRFVQGSQAVMTDPTATTMPWRANLFWVDHAQYSHRGKCQVRYVKTNERLVFEPDTLKKYESLLGHEHLKRHPANVKMVGPRSAYRSARGGKEAPTYESCEADLFALNRGDLIFGIPKAGALACFGKNVNFIWPSETSPSTMLSDFKPRMSSEEAPDAADLTFGWTVGTSARRGRVRFTTLWGPGTSEVEPMPEMELMPLTSPAGARLKSRPLTLQPVGGRTPLYDSTARLRGRKFYWHQQVDGGKAVPSQHRYDVLSESAPAIIDRKMRPAPIRPIPKDVAFRGSIEFSNLAPHELGALVAAIAPQEVFAGDYGLKIGKGKPRGLGSVSSSLELCVDVSAAERYSTLEAPRHTSSPSTVAESVERYKQWITSRLGVSSWDEISFIKDLRKLLKLPTGDSVRVYPSRFDMYGWVPDIHLPKAPVSPDGEPKGGAAMRPAPMARARDLEP